MQLKNVKILPTKYDTSTNLWPANRLLADYLTQVDRKMDAKSRRILLSLISVKLS